MTKMTFRLKIGLV